MTDGAQGPDRTTAQRGLHVITWGCQMNEYDSGRMADALAPHGYRRVVSVDEADVIILNTCHIRERAAEKVFSELGRLRLIKVRREQAGQRVLLAVAGCVAQAEGAQIVARAPFVDIVLGPQTYHRLPQMVAQAWAQAGAVIETHFPAEQKFDHLPDASAPQSPGGLTAFLTVQEGCDKFCSFCVVPYTRGAEASRPAHSILAEASRMVQAGVREITLLGQNVNAWHGEGGDGGIWGLARLIESLSKLSGLRRLRYTTSHPLDVTDDLIAAHAHIAQLMPFLHLPVQSGSDRLLARMNRRHTADQYREVVERLRGARPDLALSSDFIVGHPGETDADFEATLDLIRHVTFAQAFSFKYSPRPGTPAATSPDQVPEDVKDMRLQALQALLRQQQADFNAACLGATLPVLLTHPGRRSGQLGGRSPYLQPVHIVAPSQLIGREVMVNITATQTNSLSGTLVMETACA